jgi:uncharacterized protein (DUF1778 family)
VEAYRHIVDPLEFDEPGGRETFLDNVILRKCWPGCADGCTWPSPTDGRLVHVLRHQTGNRTFAVHSRQEVARMATKTRRIEARVDPDTDEWITQAAAMNHESVSGFMVRASREEAERVLGRADVTLMPADQFDALVDSLDVGDPAPRLARAAASARRYRTT